MYQDVFLVLIHLFLFICVTSNYRRRKYVLKGMPLTIYQMQVTVVVLGAGLPLCGSEYTGSLYYFGGLHCLSADPNDDERDWTWRPLFNSSQFSWSWPTTSAPDFPYDPKLITSLAVHPRTGTIFVSVCRQGVWCTFSYGTRGGGQWRRRGNWVLPFKGPVHYDKLLGGWVGLHLHSVDTGNADGHLCACHVISGRQPPKWKVGREQLFLKHPDWRHVDAKLVHMGELVTMPHRPARLYKAPSYRYRFDVQAFWFVDHAQACSSTQLFMFSTTFFARCIW
ncbi:hypothetical protein ZWY2020_027580 [Hordeum vulgare]|nr:hypothetical protein ZWY2020_027580 [Hordeum vulgare]